MNLAKVVLAGLAMAGGLGSSEAGAVTTLEQFRISGVLTGHQSVNSGPGSAGGDRAWSYIFNLTVPDTQTYSFDLANNTYSISEYVPNLGDYIDISFSKDQASGKFDPISADYAWFAGNGCGRIAYAVCFQQGSTTNFQIVETRNALGQPVVPEPAAWVLMILGFGIVGAAMRRNPGHSTLAPENRLAANP